MSTPAQALDRVRLEMSRTNELFTTQVISQRNLNALDEIYTANARILPPGAEMISGRQAIKEFWSKLIQSTDTKSASLTSVDAMTAGDGVVEIGRARLVFNSQAETPVQMEAKYVVYWRQEDGRWKWHVDIWNPNS